MPNWCNTTIVLSGDKSELNRFFEENKNVETGESLSLNRSVPVPSPLLGDDWQSDKNIAASNKERYGFEGWYDWRVENWGTKWEPEQPCHEFVGDKLHYYMDTAWSPPLAWIKAVSLKYPSIEFWVEYHEEAGMYPSEEQTYLNGEITSSVEIDNINVQDEE